VFRDLVALAFLILPCSIFLLVIYMWAIGITSSVTQFVKPPPPYLFSDTAVALLYFGPVLDVFSVEVCGHFFNDWLLRG
jgi:hypothetical protein